MGGAIKKFRNKNEKFEQCQSAEIKGKSHSVEKKWKGGPFCFGMAFYLMLEALDALKIKYIW